MQGLWLHSRSTSPEWEYLHLILISPVPRHSIIMIGTGVESTYLRIILSEHTITIALAKWANYQHENNILFHT